MSYAAEVLSSHGEKLIVVDDGHAVGGQPHVQFQHLRPGLHGLKEGLDRVLRPAVVTSMSDDDRSLSH